MTYNPKNNDTYQEKYSDDMISDVEIHMFKNEKGTSSKNGVRGVYSVESSIDARNNVLHFPSAKDIGQENIKLLKSLDIKTLIPFSLIKRYNREVVDLSHKQKTPIYFDINKEKFIISLDIRFLRDIKEISDLKDFKDFISKENDISIIETEEHNYVLMEYKSIDAAMTDETKSLGKLMDWYQTKYIQYQNLDDVLLVVYSSKPDEHIMFSPVMLGKTQQNEFHKNEKINLEYVRAKPVGKNKFYLYDKNEELLINKIVYFDKNKIRKQNERTINSDIFFGDSVDAVMVPYNEENLRILDEMKNELKNMFMGLNNVLFSQKTKIGLDSSLQNINSNELELLTFNSSKKMGANNVK